MSPSKLFAFTLGTLSATGGFIDIGDLVTDAQVGARFGLGLAWVTILSLVGICCFAEMAGRIAMTTRRPPMSVARARLGPRYALLVMLTSLTITGLLVMAELSGMALALELASSIHYLFWAPVAALMAFIVLWTLPFEAMERVYGILGLTMLVFVVAVWKLAPDWGGLLESATTTRPPPGETWSAYAFFVVALIGAQMTPYESDFFGSGAVESRWRPKDIAEMRVNVFLGFPLGAVLALAIQAAAMIIFFAPGIEVEHLSQTALPVSIALGKIGLIIAIVGIFAVTFGALMETLFAAAYDVAQYFGWSYGRLQRPARDARFMTVVILLLIAATALALTGIDPIRITIIAVSVSGALLPFMYFPLILAANDARVMGSMKNGRLSNSIGTIMLVVSSVVAIAAFPLLVLTRGGSA